MTQTYDDSLFAVGGIQCVCVLCTIDYYGMQRLFHCASSSARLSNSDAYSINVIIDEKVLIEDNE